MRQVPAEARVVELEAEVANLRRELAHQNENNAAWQCMRPSARVTCPTPAERAALDADEDVKSCAAEIAGANTSGRFGRVRAALRRASLAASAAVVSATNRILNRPARIDAQVPLVYRTAHT